MLTQIETTKGKLDFYKYEECYEVFDATKEFYPNAIVSLL